MSVQQYINLKSLNTFGIEASARYFVAVQTLAELSAVLAEEAICALPKFILGEGSNILFTENYPGLVIKNAIRGIQKVAEDDQHIWLQVGAGENWHDFVMYCVQQGYGGIENLSLIPGTVGAAPIQNIGAYGVELSDIFFQLTAINLKDGAIQIFDHAACEFGYRDSVFKNKYSGQFIILFVTCRLDKKPKFRIDYGNIQEILQTMRVEDLSIKAISDAVIHIRRSKLPDPKELGNAGSFFKNPIIRHTHFVELQKSFPAIPHFLTDDVELVKIPAAWLIEQCGWKGKRFGEVGVYEKQALILVNYGNGSGAAIKELALKIQQSIQQEFGILLMPEVNFI